MTVSLRTSLSNVQDATSFLFGGHIGPQSKKSLDKHVRQIVDGPNREWILEALADLPRYWDAMAEKMPEVAGTMQGATLLAEIDSWFRHGPDSVSSLDPDKEIPDLWIGILMVAIQLDQYWRYLEFRFSGATGLDGKDLQAELVKQQRQQEEESRLEGANKAETAGFCADMIAAVAVASSHDRAEFQKYGATALRIGALMAALVGATEAWTKESGKGGSVSLATAWRTRRQGEDMAHIVSKAFPDAYVSVLFDECRSTVTASERLAPKLARQLRAAGITAVPLAFRGQLHTPTAERERLTETLIEVCHALPGLQFPDAALLALPTYLDQPDGKPVSGEEVDLVGMVLRSILTRQLNWTSTVSGLAAKHEHASLIAFGLDRPLPPTLLRTFGPKQVHFEEVGAEMPHRAEVTVKRGGSDDSFDDSFDDGFDDVVAVVGMSIQVAGARDLNEFEAMLKTGESQHEIITPERMTSDMLFRPKTDADRKWYGNFMHDADAFDHTFFRKSPRESMAIDPQGRLSLEATYHALAQSGYFNELSTADAAWQERYRRIGVYVGLCSYEYDVNIHCHPTSAFTGTGELRSFIPGRVSHYFGWTGPSRTFDTACSSSTTALHTACRDVLSDEVPAAICCGVNVLTNLQWTQNLAAGSFISPTGQCKPFDADADGYCRGDGIAYVFLKKLSTAVADGNTILGTIRGTGINQNLNSTPLFVPNVPSLSTLFHDVMRKARVDPGHVSLVECHGTGTPVGDPADTVLPIGSVKGHIGHTEGASGLVALIKVLLMMRHSFIPPQASFQTMNPYIQAEPSDKMEVATSLRHWPGDKKVALINNYGACGSNSSVVVAHLASERSKKQTASSSSSSPRLPFWITGLDIRISPPTVLYWSNPALPQGLIFSCRSLDELQERLARAATATKETAASADIAPVPAERPVILCFGGQVSTSVGLDRAVYEEAAVFRYHLDACDAAIRENHGLDSIYPDIFSSEPYGDVVKLQTALFAVQYASAKSWLDCGLAGKVVAVVGHNFGEITALCVAGVLSLKDTVRLVVARAQLVQSAWGPDTGAMMAIEADEAQVHDVLQKANTDSTSATSAAIACYNGPRSFTIAGSTEAIDVFAGQLDRDGRGLKNKRLNVTNAFHSALVEDRLIKRLDEVGRKLTFHQAAIPIERATEHGNDSQPDCTFAGAHMRQPVFFRHAVQRLAQKHPQAIFLEAGSNSTIAVMASRALDPSTSTSDAHHFQSIAITNTKKGVDRLTEAIVELWKQGLRVSFWPHHRMQTSEYGPLLLLPPYQFEKSRHWLELKSPIEQALQVVAQVDGGRKHVGAVDPKTLPLWTFLGFQDDKKTKKTKTKLARFRINTASDTYQRLFSTHVIAKTAPIAPATLEIDLAIETLFSLQPDWRANTFSPVVRDMVSHSPICADPTRDYYIDLEQLDHAGTDWHWTIHSIGTSSSDDNKHADGLIHMYASSDPALLREFGRFERLVSHAQCEAVLAWGPADEGVEAIQGLRNVYRAFDEVVDFGPVYRGVHYIVGRGNGESAESAGVVQRRHAGNTWLDVPQADAYGQVAGMYVNLLTDIPASDMFVATGLELVMRSPDVQPATDGDENGPGLWHVLARHSRQAEGKTYTTDIFVFDASTGALAEVILGLVYVRVPKATMSKVLQRVTVDKSFVRETRFSSIVGATATTSPPVSRPKKTAKRNKTKSGPRDITDEVCAVVADVSGIAVSDMTLDSEMGDLGIDSLMGMELAREIENTFHCTLDRAETVMVTCLGQFVTCVSNALVKAGMEEGEEKDEDDDDDDDDNAGSNTSTDADSGGEYTTDTASGSTTPVDDSGLVSGSPTPGSLPVPVPPAKVIDRGDVAAREAEALRLVATFTDGWESPALAAAESATVRSGSRGAVVVVTGASGSLGSHIVQAVAERPDVATVVCINRPVSSVSAEKRQEEAFSSRGIHLSAAARHKIRVYGTDASKRQLGLSDHEYGWLARHGTHIVHNAWPMSATRPLSAFAPQLQTMRNLLDLARDMATGLEPRRIGFQFISSIGVTGFAAASPVLEQAMPMDAVMPSGYNEGKWACERMLTVTLRRHPTLFRAMVARPGQISGSTVSGFWNPVEHLAFLLKSAHTLGALPDLRGVLHWLPVDRSAHVMVDLLNIDNRADATEAYPVYHVDNPVGQPWKDVLAVLADALGVPRDGIVPFSTWIQRVRQSSLSTSENPAMFVLGFLEGHFERMACGGIVLDTQRSSEHSKTMATEGPVQAEVVRSVEHESRGDRQFVTSAEYASETSKLKVTRLAHYQQADTMKIPRSALLLGAGAVGVIADVHELIVGTFGTDSLYTLVFDDVSLALHLTGNTTTTGASSWIALSHDKKHLYGTSFTSSSPAFISYSLAGATNITLDTTVDAGGNCTGKAIYVVAAERAPYSVYGSFFGGSAGCGAVLSVDEDGALAAAVQNFTYASGSGVHGLALAPSGPFLYSADDSGNQIWTHHIDNSTGAVSVVGHLSSPATGSDPRHVTVHPSGQYLYVVLEGTSKVAVYALDGTTGLPTATNVTYLLLPSGEDAADYWADEVALSTSSRYLWASNRARSSDSTGYLSAFRLSAGGTVQSQLFLVPTTSSGGAANSVAPSGFSDRFVALTDSSAGFVEIWEMAANGTTASPVAHIDLADGGCCANACVHWL
ncbi:polyketide synthase [Grosmannia clavigera kw1407]|uniref:Polyketide synthase n=1 Tax=Grosmannia clavigera (strain kw1407 / UAMH 11150) TaxID=655863 RepID=F0XBR1_GROCL|nr:polyketide synthase [Grosmannia clavigera kw1407]EFX04833.1 polyketide synthase [Grosmannia clavigera kw1407]